MKEMEYKKLPYKFEILHEGVYGSRKFYIVSYGHHPCAYVQKLEDEPRDYYDNYYDEVDVHGGFTWCNCLKQIGINDGVTYLGWDYGHFDDYTFSDGDEPLKKWTTEEIFEEVKNVINQLNKLRRSKLYV